MRGQDGGVETGPVDGAAAAGVEGAAVEAHSGLLAGVEQGGAGGHEEGCRDRDGLFTAAIAVDDAVLVMVLQETEEKAVGSRTKSGVIEADLQGAGIGVGAEAAEEVPVVAHVHAAALVGIVILRAAAGARGLAEQEDIRLDRAQGEAQRLVEGANSVTAVGAPPDIKAKAVDIEFAQPVLVDLEHVAARLGVAPVPVDQGIGKSAVIDDAIAGDRLPQAVGVVVDRFVLKKIVITAVFAIGAGVEGAGMGAAGVVGGDVEDHPQPGLVGAPHELPEILICAVVRIDMEKIDNVVADIGALVNITLDVHHRQHPDGVEAHRLDIAQAGDGFGDASACREGLEEDAVDAGLAHPLRHRRGAGQNDAAVGEDGEEGLGAAAEAVGVGGGELEAVIPGPCGGIDLQHQFAAAINSRQGDRIEHRSGPAIAHRFVLRIAGAAGNFDLVPAAREGDAGHRVLRQGIAQEEGVTVDGRAGVVGQAEHEGVDPAAAGDAAGVFPVRLRHDIDGGFARLTQADGGDLLEGAVDLPAHDPLRGQEAVA
ncbi:MAG: hypothetical protein BWY77_01040 [bacterium ADurb.Bin431]|nr:MAG: hypothetical protein BWY77_01040 [bacterium ADurb.Bin431]